jgi:hypothetical protein
MRGRYQPAMRGALSGTLLALVGSATLALGADQPAATGAPAAVEPVFRTEVKGTVPDLTGRWLAVSTVRASQVMKEKVAPENAQWDATARFWSVTTVGGKPQLTVHWVRLPDSLQEALAPAAKEGRLWEPTETQLREIRDGWDSLPPYESHVVRVETTIMEKQAFTELVQGEPEMQKAEFVVQLAIDFMPGEGRPMKDVLFYGVTDTLPDGYRGSLTTASMIAAPFPIPLMFNGTFRLYRLDSVPQAGLLQRVLGMFSGCGRTTSAAAPDRR